MAESAEPSSYSLPRNVQFTTTHWSVVLAAGKEEDTTKAMVALEKLCRTYWYPLYAYVRRRGYSEQAAQDLTQGFFASLLKRHAIGRIEKGFGTFRSYLLTSHAMLDLLLAFGAKPGFGDQSGFEPLAWAEDPDLKSRLLALEKAAKPRKRQLP